MGGSEAHLNDLLLPNHLDRDGFYGAEVVSQVDLHEGAMPKKAIKFVAAVEDGTALRQSSEWGHLLDQEVLGYTDRLLYADLSLNPILPIDDSNDGCRQWLPTISD